MPEYAANSKNLSGFKTEIGGEGPEYWGLKVRKFSEIRVSSLEVDPSEMLRDKYFAPESISPPLSSSFPKVWPKGKFTTAQSINFL